jgi:hypothetical protein
MWDKVERTFGEAIRMTGHLGREQWIFVFAVALVIGAFLLRGFGSQLR